MAKKAMVNKSKRPQKFQVRSTHVVNVVAVLTQFYVNTNSAVFASASWLTRVRFRV